MSVCVCMRVHACARIVFQNREDAHSIEELHKAPLHGFICVCPCFENNKLEK